jgi:hypothetical protein
MRNTKYTNICPLSRVPPPVSRTMWACQLDIFYKGHPGAMTVQTSTLVAAMTYIKLQFAFLALILRSLSCGDWAKSSLKPLVIDGMVFDEARLDVIISVLVSGFESSSILEDIYFKALDAWCLGPSNSTRYDRLQ